MESFKTDPGICSTCIHIEKCEHYQKSDQAIWFCENFDDTVPVASKPPHEAEVSKPPANLANGYMGLCVNCDLRETCVNAKKLGGVWHCEEYQ